MCEQVNTQAQVLRLITTEIVADKYYDISNDQLRQGLLCSKL